MAGTFSRSAPTIDPQKKPCRCRLCNARVSPPPSTKRNLAGAACAMPESAPPPPPKETLQVPPVQCPSQPPPLHQKKPCRCRLCNAHAWPLLGLGRTITSHLCLFNHDVVWWHAFPNRADRTISFTLRLHKALLQRSPTVGDRLVHSAQRQPQATTRLPCSPHVRSTEYPKQGSRDKQEHGCHLKERLLDQAQTRAPRTPLFWGHPGSIPQCMISDVQPLGKSSLWETKLSRNEFFEFDLSTGSIFFCALWPLCVNLQRPGSCTIFFFLYINLQPNGRDLGSEFREPLVGPLMGPGQ